MYGYFTKTPSAKSRGIQAVSKRSGSRVQLAPTVENMRIYSGSRAQLAPTIAVSAVGVLMVLLKQSVFLLLSVLFEELRFGQLLILTIHCNHSIVGDINGKRFWWYVVIDFEILYLQHLS